MARKSTPDDFLMIQMRMCRDAHLMPQMLLLKKRYFEWYGGVQEWKFHSLGFYSADPFITPIIWLQLNQFIAIFCEDNLHLLEKIYS